MKSKKKPIEALTSDDLGVDAAPRLATVEVAEPAKRKGGVMVGSVKELVQRLRDEAGVI
jgi:electron transfer flavoprotein beta subunit